MRRLFSLRRPCLSFLWWCVHWHVTATRCRFEPYSGWGMSPTCVCPLQVVVCCVVLFVCSEAPGDVCRNGVPKIRTQGHGSAWPCRQVVVCTHAPLAARDACPSLVTPPCLPFTSHLHALAGHVNCSSFGDRRYFFAVWSHHLGPVGEGQAISDLRAVHKGWEWWSRPRGGR